MNQYRKENSELFKRIIAGIIYVVLILASIYGGSVSFNLLFLFFGIVCIYEFTQLSFVKPFYLYIIFLVLWGGALLTNIFNSYIEHIFLVLSLGSDLLLIYLLWSRKNISMKLMSFLGGVFYLCGGIIFFNKVPYKDMMLNKEFAIGIFSLVWINDSMSYFVGKQIGKHKLFSAVSPNKTIEGFLGGLFSVILGSMVLSIFFPQSNMFMWYVVCVCVIVFGTLGDLIESKFKRAANLKDSGKLLPGHGGLLDRLDSIIFMGPFLYIAIKLLENVS